MAFKLKSVPPQFEGPSGASVTLTVKDHIGSVLMAKAEYDGKQLVPAGQAVSTIKLSIAKGRASLKIVFVFTASTAGVGELREESGTDSQFIRDLIGSEPFQLIKIVGK